MSHSVNPVKAKQAAQSVPAKKSQASKAEEVAKDVSEVVQLPVVNQQGLRGRNAQLLEGAIKLSQKIYKEWNVRTPPEIADEIITLDNQVAQIGEDFPGVEKIRT